MLVSIVMAVYRPDLNFLEKQLQSLNSQTYKNIEIIIRDDSYDEEYHNIIKKYVKKNINKFKYKIYNNETNIGSNKTFEELTKDANGDYIAYCDQDDIWENEKIEKLVNKIIEDNSIMVYSDLSIINDDDIVTAKSFRDIRKRLKHVYGENKFKYFIRKNSVTGCTMLIKKDVAVSSIPFNEFYVHDHWLTINASMYGKISYIEEPLVKYRIHCNNQIGSSKMVGIDSSQDYLEKRLYIERKKYEYLSKKYNLNKYQNKCVGYMINWTEDRINMFENKSMRNIIKVLKYLKEDYQLVCFEIVLANINIDFGRKFIEKLRMTKL